MPEFDQNIFTSLLRAALPKQKLLEEGVHSEYLQKQVFDVLKAEESVALRDIDFGAFELRHVCPPGQEAAYARSNNGWLMRFNQFIKKTSAASLPQRRFF
jgi:hypothetical protein